MRVVSPVTAQAVRAWGWGALLAWSEAMTSKVTVEVARFPEESWTL